MKELTWNELLEVPDEIKLIYVAAFMNIPISTRDYESAKKKYPEYFE